MNILITGGTGYVGKNLVRALLKEGDTVFMLKRKNSINELKDQNLVEIEYDGSYESLEQISCKIDTVYHLATCFLIEHNLKDIKDLVEANILLGIHILEYMARNNIKNFINTETYAVSIDGQEINPQNLYSATKAAFLPILKFYVDTYDMKAISLVLSDTYGEGDRRKKFLNLVLEALKQEAGTFKMSLGEQEICYINVEDVTKAYLEAKKLIKELNEKDLKRYSVFGKEILTLNALVEKLEKLFEKKLRIEKGYYSYRKREIMKFNYLNIQRLPNWIPQITLEEGVKKLWK